MTIYKSLSLIEERLNRQRNQLTSQWASEKWLRNQRNAVEDGERDRPETAAEMRQQWDRQKEKESERKSLKMHLFIFTFLLLSLTVRHKRSARLTYWRVIYRAINTASRPQPQCQTRMSNVSEIVRIYVPAYVMNIALPVITIEIDHVIFPQSENKEWKFSHHWCEIA